MIVHFVASTKNLQQNIGTHRTIIDEIYHHGHNLSRDWVEVAYHKSKNDTLKTTDWHVLYDQMVRDLARADVVVVETTDCTFGVGYQAALALQQNRPTLLLSPIKSVGGAFIDGLQHDFLERKKWSGATLRTAVADFLRNYQGDNRVTLDVDDRTRKYLQVKAKAQASTPQDVLRHILSRHTQGENE